MLRIKKKAKTKLFISLGYAGLFVSGLLGANAASANQNVLICSAGDLPNVGVTHNLSPNFFGVNIENAYSGSDAFEWTDPVAQAAIINSGIKSVRFPAGQASNYWEWQTGWVWPSFPAANDPTIDVGTTPVANDSLESLQRLLNATNSISLFQLNVLSYNNQLLSPANRPRLLADAINYQISMLQSAQSLDIPIVNIELGNEFFFDDPSWAQDYATTFTGGADYATQMNKWISALKMAFPAAKIAVLGHQLGIGQDSREINWGSQVLATITGANAMTLHRYDSSVSYSGSEVNAVLAKVFSNWTSFANTLTQLSNKNMEAWITEFGGFQDCSSRYHYTGTWLEGLYQAQMVLQFLSSPAITQIELYNLSGAVNSLYFQNSSSYWMSCHDNNLTFKGKPGNLTATGQAYALIGRALNGHGAMSATQLQFSTAPMVSPTSGEPKFTAYPSVSGVWLKPTSGTGVSEWILTNLSGKAVNLSYPAMGVGTMETLQASSPLKLVTSNSSLSDTTTSFNGTQFTLPPYSINRVETTVTLSCNVPENPDL